MFQSLTNIFTANLQEKDYYCELSKHLVMSIKSMNAEKLIGAILYDYENFDPNVKGYSLAIFFIASMKREVLQKIFGKPLKHTEFGEGDLDINENELKLIRYVFDGLNTDSN